MMQLVFASATTASNCSLLIPGTFPFKFRCDSVIEPSATVMSHLVSNSSAVKPAAFNKKADFHSKASCMRSSNQFFRVCANAAFKPA